jgi:hypothetical protein
MMVCAAHVNSVKSVIEVCSGAPVRNEFHGSFHDLYQKSVYFIIYDYFSYDI